MRRTVLALAVAFLFVPIALGQTPAPSVTSVSGTPTNGSGLTISGTNLVAEDTSHYDPWHAAHPNAANFNGAGPLADGWYEPGFAQGGRYVTDVKLSGAHSMAYTITGAGAGVDRGDASTITTVNLHEHYFRAYYRVTATGGWPIARFKTFYLQAPAHSNSFTLGQAGSPWGPNMWFADGGYTPPWRFPPYPNGNLTPGQWYCIEWYRRTVTGGTWTAWLDGTLVLNNVVPSDVATWEQFIMGIPSGTDGPVGMQLNVWLGSVAFGTSRLYPLAKVEIGNSSDYATATKRYQPPTSLSDTSIGVTCDLTGLGAGPYWLWVTNNRQQRSPAIPLAAGGSPAPPAPPSGVRIQ